MFENWNCMMKAFSLGKRLVDKGQWKVQTKLMPSVYLYQKPIIQAVWSSGM